MSEKINLEVDNIFLEKLFGLADMPSPDSPSIEDLNNVVQLIRKKLDDAILGAASISSQPGASSTAPAVNEDVQSAETAINRPKSVLIVDDLGIITFQLESLFKKLGFEAVVSRELYDAIEKFKKQDFGYAILDLFIPTEREGFILLDEIKKLSLLCKLSTKIVLMSASGKKEYREKCLNRGADHFVEKAPGWQKKIVEVCLK